MGTPRLSRKFKTALVTGASSGLGLAFAEMLIDEGIEVFGTTRNPQREDLYPEINWLGMKGNSTEAVNRFTEQHGYLLGSLDILVNNAGSSYFSRESSTISEITIQQQNLLYGTPVRLCQQVIGGMRERGFGAIVNVSSLAALFPLPYMAGYSAGKAGLSSYTQGLMLVERASGILLIDFQAGDYKTAFNANIRKEGLEDVNMLRAWKRLEDNMLKSPAPGRAAGDLRMALAEGRSRVIRSGGFFQRVIAPLGLRVLPLRLQQWAIRRYYRID